MPRFLQWNVFEDGLADTPASIGFSSDFSQRLSALLRVLSDSSGAGTPAAAEAPAEDSQ